VWSASHGVLLGEGTHSIDTIEGANINVTVGAGQIGGHILLLWGVTSGIDVINLWEINPDGSLTPVSVLGMVDGLFTGLQASFDLTGPAL